MTQPRAEGRLSWREGKTTAERGYGSRWQKARERFLFAHPLCERCKKRNRTTVATVVNHRIPHKGDQALFWDEANWEPACKPCHDSDIRREEQGSKPKPHIGMDGWPIG